MILGLKFENFLRFVKWEASIDQKLLQFLSYAMRVALKGIKGLIDSRSPVSTTKTISTQKSQYAIITTFSANQILTRQLRKNGVI